MRHLRGGTDPIPVDNPYIAGSVTFASLVSGTGDTNVDLDPATIAWGTDFGATTASNHFDLQDNGSGTHAITLLANGLYLIDVYASFTRNSAPVPAAGSVAHLGLNGSSQIGGGQTSLWKNTLVGGNSYSAEPSIRAWSNWPVSYGAPPIFHTVSIGQNSGQTITTIVIDFVAVWLNEGNTGF